MLAAANGKLDCVRILVDYNASLTKKDKQGRTARDYAVMKEKDKIVEYIDEELAEDECEYEEVPDDGLSSKGNTQIAGAIPR